MLIIIVIAVIIILIGEYSIAKNMLPYVVYNSYMEKSLHEPGEKVEIISEVTNYSRLPVAFVRIREALNIEAELAEGLNDAYTGTLWHTIEKTFSIKGREKLTKHAYCIFNKRGIYNFGDYEISVGDIFGFRETTAVGAVPHEVVIMPERAEERKLQEIVQGFIGDISVRRFIMEDPILTIGFNDYTGYEPMKDISWVRTAVANKLQVKKYDHTTDINVTVMLNCDGTGDEELEECYRITRMVVEELEKAHIPYAFRTNGMMFGPTGRMEYVPKGLGEMHLKEILFGLATAKMHRVYSFETLVNKVIKERKQSENYFVITRTLDAKGTEALNRLQRNCDGKLGIITAEEATV